MGEKILKSRIIHKHGTAADWSKATTFIPKQGELIIYDKDSTHSYERVKIGDGVTTVSSLPFIDANKVDKVNGKGLSTNDYTTIEKNKLAGIDEGANKTVIDSALSSTSENPVQNKAVNTAISDLQTKIGNTSVSSQIMTAIDAITPDSIGAAASSHNQAASTITSGTLSSNRLPTVPITKGGTGATTASSARTNLGFTYGTTEPSGTPDTGEGSVYFKAGGDAIVDVGTDGIWTYRKWASGIAECWGNGQYAVDCTTAAGSLYCGSTTITLPSGLFSASTYSVLATCGTSTGSGWPVYGRTGSPSTSSFNAAFYNTASASGKVINVQMYVVGRWK